MTKSENFAPLLNRFISDPELISFCLNWFDYYVGDWFFTSGASSTGKFHPKFAQGEGGLVRHTKAVILFAVEMIKLAPYCYLPEQYKNYIIAAAALHDTRKYGRMEYDREAFYKYHGEIAALDIYEALEGWGYLENHPDAWLMTDAIHSHMGQWCESYQDRPMTKIAEAIHLADYMASRPFIDIPSFGEDE